MKKCVIAALGLLLVLFIGCAQSDKEADLHTRIKQLEEAYKNVGVRRKSDAVKVWVKGLVERNAAIQYSVMNNALKKQYSKELEKTAPNWVTGARDTKVSDYSVTDISGFEGELYIYSLDIYVNDKSGEKKYIAVLAIKQNNGFWQVESVFTDEELLIHTGFLE